MSKPASKPCRVCGEEKPVTDFYPRDNSRDGYRHDCKACCRERSKQRRMEADEDAAREYARRYREANRDRVRAYNRDYMRRLRSSRPEVAAAHKEVGRALRDGRLQPSPCVECGDPAEAHHPDYSKPLDVVWLCRRHHQRVHAAQRISA